MSIKRFNEFPDGSGNLSNDDILLFMDDPSNNRITKKINLDQLISFTNNNCIKSDTTTIPGASGINNIVQITQANYNALITKDPNTLYFIV